MAESNGYNLYIYSPSMPLAIVFAVVYGIMVPLHLYFAIIRPCRHRDKLSVSDRHRYTIPLVCASTLSTSGYLVRVVGVQQKNWSNITLYAISSSYIVISPIFICATLYLLLTRMMQRCSPEPVSRADQGRWHESGGEAPLKYLGLKPAWLGRIFIASDIMSFLTQCAGSGIASSGNWDGDLGKAGVDVLRVGLALQLVTFIVYLCFFAMFWYRVRATVDISVLQREAKLAWGAAIASFLILLRSVYRTVEFALGIDGYPFQHEWMLYVLEAAPVLIALGILVWRHPIRCLQTSRLHGKTGVDKTNRDAETGL